MTSPYYDNLWYIHIPKCGGTSIKNALDIDTGHQTLSSMKHSMDDKHYDNAFKIAFVRNPYDRMRSLYMFNRKHEIHGLDEEVPFDQWLQLTLLEHKQPYYYNEDYFKPALDWVSLDGRTVAVDFLGLTECIQQDFEKLCYILDVRADLPLLNSSKGEKPVYTEQTRQIIRNTFRKDLIKWYGWGL